MKTSETLSGLIWNINQQPDYLHELIEQENFPDLLFLLETPKDYKSFQKDIGSKLLSYQLIGHKPVSSRSKNGISFFVKTENYANVDSCIFSNSIQRISGFIYSKQWIFIIVHLLDRYSHTTLSQLGYSIETNREIQEIEKSIFENFEKKRRTIVVGDFNMNPFEEGMRLPSSFHAPYSVETIQQRISKFTKKSSLLFVYEHLERTWQGKEFPYFYNPMWRFLGLANMNSIYPQGTYYLNSPDYSEENWNILDQILIRPELLPQFEEPNQLKIVDKIGERPILPIKATDPQYDHIPVYFELKLL